MGSVSDAIEIPFFLPQMRDGKAHHVISKGQKPKFYRVVDLKDIGEGHTIWVYEFEKIFVGLYLALDMAVPYCFRTPDGQIRSLDAGCMKMMLNRSPPDIHLNVDEEGYISSVQPSERLLKRFEVVKYKLKDTIVLAKPE